jgi:hypothetical protein
MMPNGLDTHPVAGTGKPALQRRGQPFEILAQNRGDIDSCTGRRRWRPNEPAALQALARKTQAMHRRDI